MRRRRPALVASLAAAALTLAGCGLGSEDSGSSGGATPASTGVAPEPGHALEHLILSYANVESEALAELIRACPRLRLLEADNTRLTGLVLREFVQRARERRRRDAKIVAVDCRSVVEHTVRELATDAGLTGSARNLADGRVEVVLEGPDDVVAAVLAALDGPRAPGTVTGIDSAEAPGQGSRGFTTE